MLTRLFSLTLLFSLTATAGVDEAIRAALEANPSLSAPARQVRILVLDDQILLKGLVMNEAEAEVVWQTTEALAPGYLLNEEFSFPVFQ